jgi:hypothetical protein
MKQVLTQFVEIAILIYFGRKSNRGDSKVAVQVSE